MRREKLLPYLYLAPSAAVLLVFWIYPLFAAFDLSLRNPQGAFVGLRNYSELLGEGTFWRAFRVSLWYVAGTVPVAMFLGLLIANLLFQKLRGMGLFRTLFFLPYVTSTVAAAMVWRWIFAPGGEGLANTVLRWLNLPAQRWYYESTGLFTILASGMGFENWPQWAQGPSLALVCVIVFSIWHSIGFDIVIFLAGLSTIPAEVYEAAAIDGATGWRRLRHVTFPLLTPIVFFLLIVSTIRSFQTFNQIYVLTREESVASTQNVTMLIFNQFYGTFNYGAASAAAILLFLILLALTAVQMGVMGSRTHY